MALGSNNPFPSILVVESTAAPTTPSTGRQRVYIAAATHHVSRVTSSGGTVDLESIDETKLSLTDITTANTSTGKHGLAPKLVGDATKFLDGTGAWTVPSSTGGGSGTPGGSDKYIQYNNAGAFGGIAPGAVGTVLTSNSTSSTPSFQAATSGALVLLEQHTASTSASLDFTTFISSTYDTYQFQFVNVLPASNNVDLYLLFGTGAGPTWDTGSNYNWSMAEWNQGAGGQAFGGGIGTTQIIIAKGQISTSTFTYNGHAELYNPQSTSQYKFVTVDASYRDFNSNFYRMLSGGEYISATAVTGIQFKYNSGNIASGTIRVYGITK